MTTIKSIKFKPYRHRLEPITEVRRSVINFYEGYLELIVDYDFELYKPEPDDYTYRKHCEIIPKGIISLEITECRVVDDEPEVTPYVSISNNSGFGTRLYVETMEEAYDIYNQIKDWLIKN